MPNVLPTNGSGNQTAALLRTHSYTGKEYIADNIKRTLFAFPNLVAAADLVSMGVGTADVDELNATEISGLECATTESYSCIWVIPDEIDVSEEIKTRCLWGDEAAASTDVQTIVATFQEVETGVDAMVAPATAVDTAIDAQADLAADIPQWSSYSVVDGGAITDEPGEDLMNWKHTFTLATLTAAWIMLGEVNFFRRFVG